MQLLLRCHRLTVIATPVPTTFSLSSSLSTRTSTTSMVPLHLLLQLQGHQQLPMQLPLPMPLPTVAMTTTVLHVHLSLSPASMKPLKRSAFFFVLQNSTRRSGCQSACRRATSCLLVTSFHCTHHALLYSTSYHAMHSALCLQRCNAHMLPWMLCGPLLHHDDTTSHVASLPCSTSLVVFIHLCVN